MKDFMPDSSITPLYMNDDQIGKLVLGADAKSWPDIAAALEKEGLPRIDPLTGKRYYPAVRQFLDVRNNLSDNKPMPMVDGEEIWE